MRRSRASARSSNNIGDPLVASTNVMTNPALAANLNDLISLEGRGAKLCRAPLPFKTGLSLS